MFFFLGDIIYHIYPTKTLGLILSGRRTISTMHCWYCSTCESNLFLSVLLDFLPSRLSLAPNSQSLLVWTSLNFHSCRPQLIFSSHVVVCQISNFWHWNSNFWFRQHYFRLVQMCFPQQALNVFEGPGHSLRMGRKCFEGSALNGRRKWPGIELYGWMLGQTWDFFQPQSVGHFFPLQMWGYQLTTPGETLRKAWNIRDINQK